MFLANSFGHKNQTAASFISTCTVHLSQREPAIFPLFQKSSQMNHGNLHANCMVVCLGRLCNAFYFCSHMHNLDIVTLLYLPLRENEAFPSLCTPGWRGKTEHPLVVRSCLIKSCQAMNWLCSTQGFQAAVPLTV